jgi:hypothetical protein
MWVQNVGAAVERPDLVTAVAIGFFDRSLQRERDQIATAVFEYRLVKGHTVTGSGGEFQHGVSINVFALRNWSCSQRAMISSARSSSRNSWIIISSIGCLSGGNDFPVDDVIVVDPVTHDAY